MRSAIQDISEIKKAVDFAVSKSSSLSELYFCLFEKNILFCPSLINESNRSVAGSVFICNQKKYKSSEIGKKYSLNKIMSDCGISNPVCDDDFELMEMLYCKSIVADQAEGLSFPVRYGVSINHMVTVLDEDVDVLYESDMDTKNRYSFLTPSLSPKFVKIKSISVPSWNALIEFSYENYTDSKPSKIKFTENDQVEITTGDKSLSRAIRGKGEKLRAVILRYLSLSFESEIIISHRVKLNMSGDVVMKTIINAAISGLENCQASVFIE
jgi:hypothetical protein